MFVQGFAKIHVVRIRVINSTFQCEDYLQYIILVHKQKEKIEIVCQEQVILISQGYEIKQKCTCTCTLRMHSSVNMFPELADTQLATDVNVAQLHVVVVHKSLTHWLDVHRGLTHWLDYPEVLHTASCTQKSDTLLHVHGVEKSLALYPGTAPSIFEEDNEKKPGIGRKLDCHMVKFSTSIAMADVEEVVQQT